MADKGAKQGGKMDLVADVGMPKCEIKQNILSYFYENWKDEWTKYPKARMTKLFLKGPNKNQAKYVLKINRIELSRYIKLITGHNGLFYFKSKIDRDISPICRFCLEDDETFHHLVTNCPRHRNNIFLDEIPDFNSNWAVRALISFSNLTGIGEALDLSLIHI